jgi:hypothetical protein
LPVASPQPPWSDVVATSAVVGFGLWLWLWPLAGMALVAPLAVLTVWPFLALRGAVAPSWLARASCASERGFAAFGQAFDDTAGMRGAFLIVEALALFGAVFAFVNAYAALALLLLLGNELLGMEVAFVSSFLSLDNAFVLLVLAAFVLVLLEPLRAAMSAQAFVDARSRRDGADLHAAVDAAIASAVPRSRLARGSSPPSAAALLLLASCALGPSAAHAQPSEDEQADEPAVVEQATPGDERVRGRVDEILRRSEFREFAERDSGWLGNLFERFSQWLKSLAHDDHEDAAHHPDGNTGPVSPWALMTVAVLALLLIAAYASSRGRGALLASGRAQEAAKPIANEPLTLIDDAAASAARGDMRAALRALYLSTLASLDRARLIEFDASKTNGQYIRAMQRGHARQLFADFTFIFDRTWYGHEPATFDDYATCRRLAEQIGDLGRT